MWRYHTLKPPWTPDPYSQTPPGLPTPSETPSSGPPTPLPDPLLGPFRQKDPQTPPGPQLQDPSWIANPLRQTLYWTQLPLPDPPPGPQDLLPNPFRQTDPQTPPGPQLPDDTSFSCITLLVLLKVKFYVFGCL